MTNRDIDDILKRSAEAKPQVDPDILNRISMSIGSSLRPVRTIPAAWILVVGLISICGAIGIGGGLLLGAHGIQKMSGLEIGIIFSALAGLAWLAAALSVAEIIPGSKRPMPPWLLVVSSCIGLAAVFGFLFHDYHTEKFVSQGLKCLTAGLLIAAPASLCAWSLLKRGFAVNRMAAGLATGTLAGLAGVIMLELHCPNFEALHVMTWHIAVIPISGALVAFAAFTASSASRRYDKSQ